MAHNLSRREFLGFLATASAGWYLSFDSSTPAWAAPSQGFFEKSGPIDRQLGDRAPAVFSGDDFSRAHTALWDLPAYLAKAPAPKEWETTDLTVIGGGLSGLFSTYAFRAFRPILLEQGARFGGNAQGQSWRGIDYGMGSAYFPQPDPGSPLHRFYKELRLDKIVQRAPSDEPVAIGGKLLKGFWEGAAEPAHAATYKKLSAFLKTVHAAKNNPFPEIPPMNPRTAAFLKTLDAKNLTDALTAEVGALPPLLSRAIEAYCWSALGAPPEEVSAAVGISFLASEAAPLCVAPGGNAGVAEHLLHSALDAGVPSGNLRTNSLVLQVQVEGDKVKVLYEDATGKRRGVIAKAAILACPKFVAAKILDGMEPDRAAAIGEIEYRSYATAAVLITKPMAQRIYDVFLPSNADTPLSTPPAGATDVVVGSLGQARGRNTVLTLYRAFPTRTARTELLAKDAYTSVRARFQAQIEKELLPLFGFKTSDVADLRIARFGHALPIAKQGIIARGLPDRLRAPFKSRVFFIEQDNWLTPAMETGVGELTVQEPLILSALGQPEIARAKR